MFFFKRQTPGSLAGKITLILKEGNLSAFGLEEVRFCPQSALELECLQIQNVTCLEVEMTKMAELYPTTRRIVCSEPSIEVCAVMGGRGGKQKEDREQRSSLLIITSLLYSSDNERMGVFLLYL